MSTLELEDFLADDDWGLGAPKSTHDDPVAAGLDTLSLPEQRDNQDDVMGESLPPASAGTDDALWGANASGGDPFPASELPMPSGVPHNASAHSELFSQLADVLPDPALVDMAPPLDAGTGGISLGVPFGATSGPPRPRKTTEHPNAVNRHKIACHHPPYRITHCDGVLGDGVENLQGSGKSRVAFLCHKCVAVGNVEQARWSQLIEKVEDDPDPVIQKSEKLSRKERAMPDACLRGGTGYKCSKCQHIKVFNADLAFHGVVFCQCPPCPICQRKSCKCQKTAAVLGNGLLPTLPDLPALAPVPQRSMMVGGGSELSESGQAFSVACAIASAQNAIAQATTPQPAKTVVASAKPILAQTVGATAPASAPKQDPPASSNAETVAPPKPARPVLLPTSVVPGSSRAIYGGKPKGSVPSPSESDAEDDARDDAADAQDEPSEDSIATASAFRTVEGVCMPSNDDDAEEPPPAPTPSAESTAVARSTVPLRKRKAMKPIANSRLTKAAATPCEVCSKPGSSIRCKHKKCSARVCSALCGGYRNDANMNWAGGWACSQHMASPDDHAWYCPSCSKMVTDRTDNDEIGSIIPSIGCDKCNAWYCLECVGLHKRKRLPDTWYCGKC